MVFNTFVRKPFVVEATQVDENNIEEIAKMIGELRHKDNGTPYISVDRRLVPNLFRVYYGFWVTKLGDNIRCYSNRIFTQQFVETDQEIHDWVSYIDKVANAHWDAVAGKDIKVETLPSNETTI